jgi:hypothetical protein
VSITPQATVSVTPPITPSRSPLTITALYYNNQEFNDGTVFLDGNVAVNQNGSNIVNEVFTTPGDVLYTGGTIFQDDSLFAQASGNTTAYPVPSFGTSTRRLHIVDSAGNTINDTTVGYTASTNKTFSVVGGRTYYVRGYTNFSYPTSAILTVSSLADNGSGQYVILCTLDTAVDGNFTIDSPYGVGADMYLGSDCNGPSEGSVGNNASLTVTKGQYGLFNLTTGLAPIYGFSAYRFYGYVYIDGNYYSHGSTFTRGATTVTVNIDTNCNLIPT